MRIKFWVEPIPFSFNLDYFDKKLETKAVRKFIDAAGCWLQKLRHQNNTDTRSAPPYRVDLLRAAGRSFQHDAALDPFDHFGVLEPSVRHLAARKHFPHQHACPHK